MKRTELFFSVLLVPLDFLSLLLAAWAAYRLRFQPFITDIRPVVYDFSALTYLRSAMLVAVAWLVIFALYGLYTRRATDPWWPEFGRVLLACSTGLVVIIVAVFFRRELFSSRFVLLAAGALAFCFVSVGRLIVRWLQRLLFRYGYGAHRLVIIGENRTADEVLAELRRHPDLGYAVVAQLPIAEASLDTLRTLFATDQVDEILFVDPAAPPESRQRFHEFSEEYHRGFRYAPDLLRWPVGQLELQLELGVPLVAVPETTIVGWGRVFKRLLDIAGSVVGLVLLAPLCLAIAVLVRLDSPGPAIYRSRRIGRGRPFTLYKFRSMKIEHCTGEAYGGASAAAYEAALIAAGNVRRGPVSKIVNDPRWTSVGRWLRRLSLDELPQLWNVLRGDMSLVGPRPHLPREVERYERHHRKVLAVKPGLTGLAQVSGRSDLAFDDEVRLDRYYLENWSPWLDIGILLKTAVAVFERRRTL